MTNDTLGELRPELKVMPERTASEATKIEQTRALAEVAMQAELAKRHPRDMTLVFEKIQETFEMSPSLVAKSRFSFPRGGQRVEGWTIEFARAVAGCVGNIVYSFKELSRESKQSEMLVYAWDLESNTQQIRSFIVPHTRDIGHGKTKSLTHERDIYENNANFSMRRLRECILGVLPGAAVRKAEDVAWELLNKAFPKEKMAEYATKNIERFKKIGVTKAMLIENRGKRPPEIWGAADMVSLKEIFEDIENGEPIETFFTASLKTINLPSIPKKSEKEQEETISPEEASAPIDDLSNFEPDW